MNKIVLFFCLLTLGLTGCKENVDFFDNVSNDIDFYNEKNYSFTLINLWGSQAAVWDDGKHYIFQGDILLDKNDSLSTLSTRGAARIDKRWPDNVVYYDDSDYPSDLHTYLWDAIKEVEMNTYVDFEPRHGQFSYIKFIYGPNEKDFAGASNYIGYKFGPQTITMTASGAKSRGIIMHEICHALGLYHEMCRTDRDKYVKIDFSSMTTQERAQFKTYQERGENGVNVGPFDFNSIMLYDSYLNDRIVMTKLDGSAFYGQRNYLSSTDITALAKAQPLGKYYTFYEPSMMDEYQRDEDFLYQRTRFLRCPEGADVDLKMEYKFDPKASALGIYSLADFDIKFTIELINWKTMQTVFIKDISVVPTSGYKSQLINVKLPQGAYRVALRLTGTCKNTSDVNAKNVLKRLLYNPLPFLTLDRVTINGVNATIPSEYGYPSDLRSKTFITF